MAGAGGSRPSLKAERGVLLTPGEETTAVHPRAEDKHVEELELSGRPSHHTHFSAAFAARQHSGKAFAPSSSAHLATPSSGTSVPTRTNS